MGSMDGYTPTLLLPEIHRPLIYLFIFIGVLLIVIDGHIANFVMESIPTQALSTNDTEDRDLG